MLALAVVALVVVNERRIAIELRSAHAALVNTNLLALVYEPPGGYWRRSTKPQSKAANSEYSSGRKSGSVACTM